MSSSLMTNIFLDQIENPIWMVNLDYQLIYANKSYLNIVKQVTGIEQQLYESAFVEDFDEEYTEKYKSYYKRALSGEKFELEEHVSNPETNDIHYGQITFEPLIGEDQKIFAIACQSRDITNIVKNRSEANQLIDASLDIFCTINEQKKFVFVSAAASTHWGYLPEELIGKPYQDLIVEEDVIKTNEIADSILNGKEVRSFFNRYNKKNGGIAYNLWSVKWDNSTKLIYCTVRDAKEIIEQEEKILHSEQRFRALVQEGSDMIAIFDPEGNYIYASPSSMSILGIPQKEFIGRNAFDFIHPEDSDRVLESLNKIVTEDQVTLAPFRFQDDKKEWRWLETVLTNMLSNPAVLGIVANSKDVTEEKKLRELTRKAYHISKIGSWEVDLLNNHIYWSEEIHKLHETDSASFKPDLKKAINFYREDYQQLVESKVENCINTGEAFEFEAVILTTSKKELWVRVIGNAEFIGGTCIRIYGSTQNINERKEAEIRLNSLADNLPGVVYQYIINPDGTDNLKYVSKGSQDVWGYSSQEVLQNNKLIWDRMEAAGDYEKVNDSIANSIAAKTNWTARWKYIMPNGELRTHLGNGTPIFLTDGTVLFNAVILDITQETKNEELLEQTTEIARIGSWEMDLINQKGDNMYWSPMLFEIVELDDSYNPTLTGGIEFHIGESKERIQKALELLIKEGTEFDVEILLRTAKGNKRWSRAIGKSEIVNNKLTKIYGSYQDIHKRKVAELDLIKAKEKAEASDAKFKAYTEQSPIAIYTTNVDGDFVYANETWLDMTGMHIEEALGKGWTSALHPDDLEQVTSNWYKSIKSNGKWNYEYRFINKSGKITWVNGSAKELLNEKNELVGYLGTNINITEKKKAEEDKFSLQKTLENSLNEIYIFDAKTLQFSYVNKGALLNLGYSENEIKALTPLDLKPDYTETSFKKLVAPLVSSEKNKIIFFTNHERKDGSQYPVEVHLQLVTEGINKRFIAIILDITERKKAEEEDRFKANLLSTIGQAAIATNLDGVVTYWNKAAENIYGWKQEEAIGNNIIDLTPVETNKEEAIQIIEALKKGRTWSGEFEMQKKDGTIFPALIANSPIYDENNEISGMIGISSDITQKVKYEKLLKQHTEELERSNAALKKIAWTQSHVVRAPISRILAVINLIEEQPDSFDEISFWLKQLKISTCEMDEIVKKIISETNNLDQE